MPVETLFLDAGGVLLFPNWNRISRSMARQGVHVAPEQLAAADAPARHGIDTARVVGSTDDAQRGQRYFDVLLRIAGVQASPATAAALKDLQAYHDECNLWELVSEDGRSSLAAIRGLGVRVVLVSNANGTLQRHVDRLGLRSLLDAVVDSHDEGIEKPDPRVFHRVLERVGAAPATTVHVGDFYQIDIVGARAAGLRAVLFDAAGLYPDVDCSRVSSLTDLVEALRTGRFG